MVVRVLERKDVVNIYNEMVKAKVQLYVSMQSEQFFNCFLYQKSQRDKWLIQVQRRRLDVEIGCM